MESSTHQRSVWALARKQHGVIDHDQLEAFDYSARAIQHRIEAGRLHPIHRGVYAVGRRELAREGEWMAAVLACGPQAALSYESAAVLLGIAKAPITPIHVSTLGESRSRDPQNRLEAAIAVADNLDLIRPDRLRKAAEKAGRRGAKLRRLLDRQTFRLTESELERYFLAIVRRTAAQQTRDREKDQALTVRGLTVLRFTHAQVIYEPDHVAKTLAAVAGY